MLEKFEKNFNKKNNSMFTLKKFQKSLFKKKKKIKIY